MALQLAALAGTADAALDLTHAFEVFIELALIVGVLMWQFDWRYVAVIVGFGLSFKGDIEEHDGGSVTADVSGFFEGNIVEALAGFYLPSGFKDTAPYIVVLLMLVLKPNGLFGEKLRKKV